VTRGHGARAARQQGAERIKIRAWGLRSEWLRTRVSGHALRHDGETRIEAVCRSIERRTGYVVCGCRGDGTALDRAGQPESRHYELTLGTRLSRRSGGGYSVEGICWVAVPCAAPADEEPETSDDGEPIRRGEEWGGSSCQGKGERTC